MYRFIRDHVANPEVLKIDYQDILQEEAVGMAFPVDSIFLNNIQLYMVKWI